MPLMFLVVGFGFAIAAYLWNILTDRKASG